MAVPAAEYVLALDHGTSGCKTGLFGLDGRYVASEFEPVPVQFTPDGGAEQDPEHWWQAFLRTAQRLIGRGLVDPAQIVAVACSSTFSSTVVVDGAGRPLAPALTWLDARGAPLVRERMRGLLNIQGYGLSRLIRWLPRANGAPTLSGKDDIAHVLFWQRHRPDVYRAAAYFLSSKDYFNLRLTGRAAASPDSATLFWVLDIRDIRRVRYDRGLIAALGIDGSKLAPLRPATDLLGPLLPEVARAIGLPRPVPVAVGSADLQSACIGSGAVADYQAHLYVGTSSWLLCHLPHKRIDPFHAIAALPSAIPGRYFSANEQDSAGGCLGFLANNLLLPPGGLAAAPPPPDVYRRLDAIAAAVPAGSRGVVFTPWLNGEKTPVDSATLRAGFHNLTLTTTQADLIRAVYEGVAFNTRWVLGYLERFVRRRLDPLHIIGGGAQSAVWCQIFADVLGRTVRQVEHPIQANARGAAYLAAVGLGRLDFADIPALTRFSATFHPDAAVQSVYAERFRAFLDVYRHTRGLYARWNRV